ncbi:MAG TPA: CDP-alcohol phosphatidyltransferase family protein [Clostridiales bacterium]|nr:CDP-alcohol phosphatidyltransferase family protein [Clostridiales bacterium]
MLGFEKGFKSNCTIPNLISILRILVIAPFVVFFLREEYFVAFALIVISGVSDMMDGWIARRFNQVTELGKVLDPIADKLTLVAVIVCVGILIPGIIPLVVILVVKDLLMLCGGFVLLKQRIAPPAAKWFGKLATIIFYFSVVIIVFGKAFFDYDNPILTITLLIITAIAMLFALGNYFVMFMNLIKGKSHKVQPNNIENTTSQNS